MWMIILHWALYICFADIQILLASSTHGMEGWREGRAGQGRTTSAYPGRVRGHCIFPPYCVAQDAAAYNNQGFPEGWVSVGQRNLETELNCWSSSPHNTAFTTVVPCSRPFLDTAKMY